MHELDWVLCVLAQIASHTEDLQIFFIVAAALRERNDVVDVVLIAQFHSATRTSTTLSLKDRSNISSSMAARRVLYSGFAISMVLPGLV